MGVTGGTYGRNEGRRRIFRNEEEPEHKDRGRKIQWKGPEWVQRLNGVTIHSPCGLGNASLLGLPVALTVSAKGRNAIPDVHLLGVKGGVGGQPGQATGHWSQIFFFILNQSRC